MRTKVAVVIMNTNDYEESTIEDSINQKLAEIQANQNNKIVEVKVSTTSTSVVFSIIYKRS